MDKKIEKLREQINEAKKEYDYKKVFLLTGRLINALNKRGNKLLDESKGVVTPEIRRLMNDNQRLLMEQRNNLLLYYDKCMSDENIAKNNKDITKIRGTYIKLIGKEIKRLSENSSTLTDEERAFLNTIQVKYPKLLSDHKKMVSGRITDEVFKANTDILSPITVLPKGIKLAVENVATCIRDVKNAKDNKEKKKKIVEAAKAVGLAVATPVIFAGKFMITNWFVVLSVYGIDQVIKWLNDLPLLKDAVGVDNVWQLLEAGAKGIGNTVKDLITK